MPNTLHIAIVGGGAAGFFAATAAKQKAPHADMRKRDLLYFYIQ